MGNIQCREHAGSAGVVERKEAGNFLSFATERYNRI